MPLKYKIQSKTEIAPEHQSLSIERDGSFILDAEGVVEKARFDEIRSTNAALAKERDDFKKRFEGIDPNQVRALAEEKRRLEEQQQLKSGEVEKVLESRVKNLRADFEKQLQNLSSERDALTQRLVGIQIDQGILQTATKRGLRATALPDITARARNVFRLVNGVPTAFEADGQTVRAGRDGFTPMTLDEWIDLQVAEAPHLFEPNAGVGTAQTIASGSSGHRAVARNPFRKDTWNLTEQMRLKKQDPALAARLKASA